MLLSKLRFTLHVAIYSLYLSLVCANSQASWKNNFAEQLTEENWDRMLIGEWMVEFYAPWCPACKALEPVWDHLASQKKSLNINVGKVDVTDSPGLSGRFMVTALPTIYHVKDGIFRQYKSPRDKDSLIEFVSEKTWEKIEPIHGWKSPTSIQMSVISQFFKMAQVLRRVHNKLMEDFGLPTWGSYLIFSVATIVLGAILGLVIVCLIDLIYPPKPVALQSKKKQKDGSGGFMQEKTTQDEEIVENVKDDLVDEESEGEGSDVEEKEKDTEKDSKTEPSSPNVRKRKPRKADYGMKSTFQRVTVHNLQKLAMVKNTKKRLSSVSEAAVKTKDETVLKKKKSENGAVQNGQANKEVKKETQKVKPDKAEKIAARKAYREKRKAFRLDKKQHGIKLDISAEDIKKKVEAIEKRGNLTKTAKRKLASLKKLLRVKEGTDKPKQQVAKKPVEKGKNEKKVEAGNKKQVQTNAEQKKKVPEKAETKPAKNNKKKNVKQGRLLLVKQGESDDEDEDEEEKDIELDDDASEDDEDVDDEEEDLDDEEDEDDDDDDEEEEEEEDDDDDDEEEEEEEGKAKGAPGAQAKEASKQSPEQEGKKKRYVLFVGNLPFSVTQEEIKKHFLTKVSQIVDIRIPKKDDNSSRGFAYVELANHTDYEKAIALNNSFVNGRRIKVQYSGSNKKETVAKNQKLQALQKAGKLAGGQKRNFQKKNTGFKGQKMKT
ncbi:uncharacterized protein LOC116429991 [Nomia melanderi]|uniref:uncharacterized protein LOC116429991 n=1 Tax=Nomia melanderi TaxID=2448451 RepID=UPI003FCE26E1